LQMEYASREEFMERMAKTNFLRNQHEFNEEYAAQLIEPVGDGSVRLKLTPAAHQQTMASMTDSDLSGYFSKIQCPTLIIRATEGNLTAEVAGLMQAEIVGSQLLTLEGSNHNAMLDKPDAFDALLDPFLERVFG
ncbi:MAG: alpha/beta hydrolase, partial [Chloroflexota bacterium]